MLWDQLPDSFYHGLLNKKVIGIYIHDVEERAIFYLKRVYLCQVLPMCIVGSDYG